MSEQKAQGKTLPRPPAVTVSAVVVMLGSFMVVVLAFTGISELRSIATRDAVESGLSDWPLSTLNLSLDDALNLIQTSSMIAGACAAAMAVLGFYVFKGSRGARTALSVLAIPLVLSGLFIGGFMVSLVAVATGTLWLQPARDWFNGVPSTQKRDSIRDSTSKGIGKDTAKDTTKDRENAIPAASVAGWPPPLAAPAEPPLGTPDDPRPTAVTAACISAWIGSAVTAVFVAVSLVVLKVSPDQVIRELERQQPELAARGVEGETVISVSFVMGIVIIVWCLVALVLTTLAFRRVPWARMALLVSGFAASILTVFGAIGAVFMLPLLMACVLSISLLMRPEVRVWYASAPTAKPPVQKVQS